MWARAFPEPLGLFSYGHRRMPSSDRLIDMNGATVVRTGEFIGHPPDSRIADKPGLKTGSITMLQRLIALAAVAFFVAACETASQTSTDSAGESSSSTASSSASTSSSSGSSGSSGSSPGLLDSLSFSGCSGSSRSGSSGSSGPLGSSVLRILQDLRVLRIFYLV